MSGATACACTAGATQASAAGQPLVCKSVAGDDEDEDSGEGGDGEGEEGEEGEDGEEGAGGEEDEE